MLPSCQLHSITYSIRNSVLLGSLWTQCLKPCWWPLLASHITHILLYELLLKKRLYYAIQREKTDVHEEGDVIQWLNAEKGSIHCHQHKQMFVPIIYEGNQWCDKLHTTPRKSFCFPGSMSTWNHVGVLLFYGYPVIVPSSILNIILKDILSAWFVNSNPQTITNGNV